MKITFILPDCRPYPTGGFKVVYEYANGLVHRGHEVNVIHPSVHPFYLWKDLSVIQKVKKMYRFLDLSIGSRYRPNKWFTVDQRVNMVWVPTLNEKFIPKGDVIIATAWATAERVSSYSSSCGIKYYLIQHLETWDGPEQRVLNTWKLPLKKIVIAKWLQDTALTFKEEALYIPNGLDFKAFGIDKKICDRNQYRVLMLSHKSKAKGTKDGINALIIARKEEPKLHATLFGVHPRDVRLPEWIEYYEDPKQLDLRKLYNDASIFISPSRSEGWGLTATEAMMCGAAIIVTKIGGHLEYAVDRKNSLLSSPKDPESLAEKLLILMRNPVLKNQLAMSGWQTVQRYTWESSVTKLENYFKRDIP